MEKFILRGGKRLSGEVRISGAKNSAVAILPATILAEGECILENIPNIADVDIDLKILRELGAEVRIPDRSTIIVDTKHVRDIPVPYELARSMRASYYFLGTLLTRFNHARVSMPGGCNLGDRPIDQHLKCFKALGATGAIEHGMADIYADRLVGTQIYFDRVTVGATINAMLAAVRAGGLTILENAAKEPHVVDLANFLNSMGANIMGAGTDIIRIHGVSEMHGTEYSIIPDQIEAGTFMAVAAATKSDITITGVIPKHMEPITNKLVEMGIIIEERDDSIFVRGSRLLSGATFSRIDLKTEPHPGFPTDMQPQFAALLTMAGGSSILTERIFDNRFRYVDELRRMGADISVEGKVAVIAGVPRLTGAPVKAADLRAGAALIIAGLAAQGVTEIEDIYHIERGYENMEVKLQRIGAHIEKRVFGDRELAVSN